MKILFWLLVLNKVIFAYFQIRTKNLSCTKRSENELFEISGFWWLQEETSSESNDFYHLSTSRAGTSFRKISLSRRLFQGGARHESQFAWGSRAGTITSPRSSSYSDSLCYTTIKWINEVQSEAICCPFLFKEPKRSPNWIFSLTFIRASKGRRKLSWVTQKKTRTKNSSVDLSNYWISPKESNNCTFHFLCKTISKWVIPFTCWAFKLILKPRITYSLHQIVLPCKPYEIELSIFVFVDTVWLVDTVEWFYSKAWSIFNFLFLFSDQYSLNMTWSFPYKKEDCF